MTSVRSQLALGAVSLAIALAPAAAWAEDEAPNGPIIVTGRGLDETPAAPAYDVVDIGREALTSSPSGRIEDVLSNVAGFQQFRRSDSRSANPSAQGVTLRALGGNASSRTLVLLDGVPVGNPFFGYIPLSALTPQRLAGVRVTRGGGAGAFGSGAVAGTIELTSADPRTIGLIEADALVNDRGETQTALTATPSLGSGFVQASAQWDRGKGFYTTPQNQRVPATARAAYDSWSAAVRAVAPLTDSVEIQVAGLAYDDRRTLRFEGADSSSSGSQASLRLVGRGAWQFDALAYVQAQDFSNIVVSATSFVPTLDQKKTPATGIGGKFELRPPLGDAHVLRLGADVRLAEGELLETPISAATGRVTAIRRAGGNTSDLGFYLEDDWSIGAITLTAGARADRWTIRNGFYHEVSAAGVVNVDNRFENRSGWNSNFRGGAVWQAGSALRLRAAAYTGFRQPTLNELYRPFVVFPITTRANAELKNERLRGFEAGIDLTPIDAVTLSLTAFDNRVNDAIANVTINATTRQRQNVDAIHARGLEGTAALRLGTVSLDASVAWTDAEVKGKGASVALDGMRPAQVPRIAASTTLAWSPRANWRFAATLRHIGKQFEDDLETDALKAVTTIDAYAEVPIAGPVSLTLRGENLTDRDIMTRNQGGSIDLGTPRTLWAGMKLRLGR